MYYDWLYMYSMSMIIYVFYVYISFLFYKELRHNRTKQVVYYKVSHLLFLTFKYRVFLMLMSNPANCSL